MSPIKKPSSHPPIGNLEEEQSEIRCRPSRPDCQTMLPPAAQSREETRSLFQNVVQLDRSHTIQAQLIAAKALLETLQPTSRRAQLLRLAIVRRDQVLLEALLNDVSVD
jgi:hypothetical protein